VSHKHASSVQLGVPHPTLKRHQASGMRHQA
jgi:hypothetical protein